MTTIPSQSSIDWHAIDEETLLHLRNILRLDTRNPPGNEFLAAQYLREVLEKEGFECQVIGPTPERATVITRLQGDGSEPPILLMSHTDVVAVEPDKWSHDPFGAEIVDDILFGRGTLDMKNMVIMELMVMLLLKRTGLPLKRDVIYMAEADEETGGRQGAGWVVENHPELIQAEYALNEGGGNGFEINGKIYYTIETAEKGGSRFKIRAQGNPGHASIPHENNAIVRLAEYIQKVRNHQPPIHFTATLRGQLEGIASAQPPEVAASFRAVLASEEGADEALQKLPIDEGFKSKLRARASNTISATMLKAGTQINVIPSEAEVSMDARILPGQTQEGFRQELHAIFGADCPIEFIDYSLPLEFEPSSPLIDTIKAVLGVHAPEATVVPTMLTGGTDAKHVSKLGTVVYGFAPELYLGGEEWSGVHGHDEKIHVQAMQWGTRVLYEVVEKFAGNEKRPG